MSDPTVVVVTPEPEPQPVVVEPAATPQVVVVEDNDTDNTPDLTHEVIDLAVADNEKDHIIAELQEKVAQLEAHQFEQDVAIVDTAIATAETQEVVEEVINPVIDVELDAEPNREHGFWAHMGKRRD